MLMALTACLCPPALGLALVAVRPGWRKNEPALTLVFASCILLVLFACVTLIWSA